MGGVTAKGFPYPTGTDRVADGDNAIQSLAATIDAYLDPGSKVVPAWGAATIADTGPGLNGQMWFTNNGAIGLGPGITLAPGGQGLTVAKAGWYKVEAHGQVSFQQAGVSLATLFIGDSANGAIWALGSVSYGGSVTNQETVTAMTVVQLPAGQIVHWGMNCSGVAAAGIYGGASRSALVVTQLLI